MEFAFVYILHLVLSAEQTSTEEEDVLLNDLCTPQTGTSSWNPTPTLRLGDPFSSPEKKHRKNRQLAAATISDGMESAMGNFGRWHFLLSFSLSLINLPSAWFKLIVVFLSPPVKYSCIDPAPPANWTGAALTCSVPDADGTERPCVAWEYDRSVFTETIVTEWNLVCDRAQLANVAQMLFMAGFLIGCFLGGIFADRHGRKPVLVWSCIVQLIAGVATAFSPWFILFLILRFITAMANAATTVTGFVLLMEAVGSKWRTEVNILAGLPFSIGHCSLAGIAYLTRHWRYLEVTISIPAILLLSYIWVVPESPRWLLTTGKTEKAEDIVRHVARVNRTGGENWKAPISSRQEKTDDKKKSPGMRSLFATPVLRKCTLVMFANWISGGLVFYGLAQYMGQIGGNIFMNVFLSGLLEIPGMLIACIMLTKCGRKKALITGQIATALSSFAVLFLPKSESGATWTSLLAAVGLCSQSIAFPSCYVFAAELFPTVVRNAGVGASSTVARIGSMIAPFVATLSVINEALPPVIFGTVPFVAGLLVLFLPETLGKVLPETIEQVEERAKEKKDEKAGIKSVSGMTNPGFVDEHL